MLRLSLLRISRQAQDADSMKAWKGDEEKKKRALYSDFM